MKYKNPYGQSSIKVFYKGLSGKKGYLNLIFSDVPNKYVAVTAFGSSLIVVLSSFLKNLFVNLNLKVLISCSEKFSVITTSFEESYSELVSSSLEIPSEST